MCAIIEYITYESTAFEFREADGLGAKLVWVGVPGSCSVRMYRERIPSIRNNVAFA